MLAPVGGAGAVFGISGTNFGSLFNPFATGGSPTVVRAIGAGTANPDIPLYHSDRSNFAPAVGLGYLLPGEGKWRWLTGGKDSMTIRMGYGIGYIRMPIGAVNTAAGSEPGYTETDTTFAYTNLSNIKLPVPPAGVPLTPVPLLGPGSHTQSLYVYDPNLRTPYTQNYNVTVTRSLPASFVLNVSYVGSKSSALARAVDTNEVNIYENGILNAFNTVVGGGNSALLDKIFAPLASINCANPRTCSLTQQFFLNNNPGGLANFISTSTALKGIAGNLLAAAGLPPNYIVANPQFLHSYLIGNFGNATYNSLQADLSRRFSNGFTFQTSYVWSHNLGDSEGDFSGRTAGGIQDAYRTLRNESLDKRPLSFDYQSVFKANGIYELPIGKGKWIGRDLPGWLDHIIGGWQVGATLLAYSGRPLDFTAQNTINSGIGTVFSASNTTATTSSSYSAVAVGALPAPGVQRVGNGVVYFNGLKQVTDPSVVGLTGSSLKAITTAGGSLLLVNALPGQMGSLGYGVVRGPGAKNLNLNLNLQKTFAINERFNFELRATALDATNTPIFLDPDLNINSPAFGRITGTSTAAQAPGNRIMVLQGRLNF